MATAEPRTPSREQGARREALLRRVGFSRTDHNSFVTALRDVREELDRISQERSRIDLKTTPAAFAGLKFQEEHVLENARARLRWSLSFEGATRLERYIQDSVKRRIRIYGAAPRQ